MGEIHQFSQTPHHSMGKEKREKGEKKVEIGKATTITKSQPPIHQSSVEIFEASKNRKFKQTKKKTSISMLQEQIFRPP